MTKVRRDARVPSPRDAGGAVEGRRRRRAAADAPHTDQGRLGLLAVSPVSGICVGFSSTQSMMILGYR